MRGIPEWNYPAFDAAAKRWKDAGHQPFSPAALDRAVGNDGTTQFDDRALRHAIMMDTACLYAADAIALLPGWEKSMGTAVELSLAQFLGLDVFCAMSMKIIDPPAKPWSLCLVETNRRPVATL
jgi:hypothetical protein